MLRYIMGRTGSGKSWRVYSEINAALSSVLDKPLILLVPEQYTLQAERDLIRNLQLSGIMQAEVLSFTRLADRVFSEVGGRTRVMLNEQGKHMILRRVINQNIKNLTIYKQAARQAGFVSKCGQMISDLKQYDVDSTTLKDHAALNTGNSVLEQKIHDLVIIYDAFNEYLQGRYMDLEDYINLFIKKLTYSNFLKGSKIWIDNFATFSPQSLRIIDCLASLAGDITISLTRDCNRRSADRELFDLSEIAYRKLHGMAVRLGLPEEIVDISMRDEAVKPAELKHLERQIYAYPCQSWDDDVSHIHIFAAANVFSEVEYVAARMVEQARDYGWRWKDMAVICQDLNAYGPIIARVFPEYKIPYFMDEKREVIDHPIIQFILSSLDIVQRGYRREDICRCSKTGFTYLDPDESDEFENYLLRYGIQGKRLQDEFVSGEAERLPLLNDMRLRLILPLLTMEAKLGEFKDIRNMTRVLYEYLQDMAIPAKLAAEIETMNERGYLNMVRESTQIWNIVLDTLDQLFTIMGDQETNLKEYRQFLEAGLLSYELGIIPTTVDQVLVGTVQRSISHDIRGLFVLGVNDGVLPGIKIEDSLLDQDEKSNLASIGIELGLSRDLMIAQENFLIYNALAQPDEEIWLSYALADSEGRALRPSLLLNRVHLLFRKITPGSDLIEDRSTRLDTISTPGSTLKYMVNNLRRADDGRAIDNFWWDVFQWYGNNEAWRLKRDLIISGFQHRNQVGRINPELVEKLYKRPFRTSVSRLEQYASCPFAHFVRYGMRPAERKTFEVSAPDVGDLFHAAFLNLAGKMNEEGIDWQGLDREQCNTLMDQVMDEMVPVHADGVFNSTHRYRYLVSRLKRIGRRSAWTLTEHIQAGEFKPIGYEMRFGRGDDLPAVEIVLEDGEKLYLEGRIDRADLYEGPEAGYVRVIDYKSGRKTFDLSDAYYGLSLQLFVYLKAMLGSGKVANLKPAGIFYFRIDDPAVKSDAQVMEEIEKQISKKLRMDGLVLRDVNIVRAMDREFEGSSSVIPVGLKRDGDFDSYSSVLNEEEFALVLEHIDGLMRQITEEIIRGQARINPVMINRKKACDYCEYQAICQFDQLFENNGFRVLPQLRRDEVMLRIAPPPAEGGEQ
ncbi:MAG: helicase-exonuclease AddAB subunit AddB [Deltaproteobacteria bacterium]